MGHVAFAILAGGLLTSAFGQAGAGCVNESDIRPPVTAADVQIAHRARQILNSQARWNRADTRECPATEKTFSLYCAIEKATDEISGNFEHRGAAMQEARFIIEDISPKAKDYDHLLMGYNNDPTTTLADIQKVLTLLETRIAARLADQKLHPPPPTPPLCPPEAPQVTNADLRIIDRVRQLLGSETNWDRADTQKCAPGAAKLSLYCAFEQAEKEITGKTEDTEAINETRAVIGDTAPNRAKYKSRLTDFNNDPEVKSVDVQRILQQVHDRLAAKLAR